MTVRGRRFSVAAALLGLPIGLALAAPVLDLSTASAARLHVTAAPLQTWRVSDGLPPVTSVPDVDLSPCGDLSAYDEVRYGTPGDDLIAGGNGRQVLVGLGGDDVLLGENQDDCLLGGDGDDELRGGEGKDRLLGQAGVDLLDGGNGADTLDAGGDEGDSCADASRQDVLVGCGDPAAPVTPSENGSQPAAEAPTTNGAGPATPPAGSSSDNGAGKGGSGKGGAPAGSASGAGAPPAGGAAPADPSPGEATAPSVEVVTDPAARAAGDLVAGATKAPTH